MIQPKKFLNIENLFLGRGTGPRKISASKADCTTYLKSNLFQIHSLIRFYSLGMSSNLLFWMFIQFCTSSTDLDISFQELKNRIHMIWTNLNIDLKINMFKVDVRISLPGIWLYYTFHIGHNCFKNHLKSEIDGTILTSQNKKNGWTYRPTKPF